MSEAWISDTGGTSDPSLHIFRMYLYSSDVEVNEEEERSFSWLSVEEQRRITELRVLADAFTHLYLTN